MVDVAEPEVFVNEFAGDSPLYLVPEDDRFVSLAEPDFLFDKELEKTAEELINQYAELVALNEIRIRYAWKRKGGTSKQHEKIGGTERANTLLRALGKVDVVIWLAADHARNLSMSEHQVEAALYHELLHVGIDEYGKVTLNAHDVEMFTDEVRRYGIWKTDLKVAQEQFRQLELDFPSS